MKKKMVLLVFVFIAAFSGCDKKPDAAAADATTTSITQRKMPAASGADLKIFSEPPRVEADLELDSHVEAEGGISCDSGIVKCDSLIPIMQAFYAPLNKFEVIDSDMGSASQ